ncbi:MAG TPA: phosphoglycerate kinase, partial [Campylobacterales bacterium]|nr:phosphoglycerate kinase [Campylobacterales bacterium]
MEYILEGFILTIFIALVLNIVLAKFNIPTIIGYILTGIIISKIFSLQTENLALLTHISELGIVFMMFMIGLEFSFRYLLKIKSFVFVFGFVEVLIIGLLFSFLAYAFGLSLESALIVGFALSLSSTAIVIKMLNSSGDINSQYGIRALGILIFQDMAVIPIMLMVELFSKEGSSLVAKLFGVVVSATILLIVMYFLGRFLFEKIFTWVSKINSEELFIGSILFIVLFSSLFAHLLGFSYSLGAFVAGMLIAETRFKYQIEADIAPFRDLLLGLFFITIGMHIDPIFIFKNIYIILLLLCAIMLIKIVLIYAIVRVRTQSRTSLKVALALMQVGEFALAVFEKELKNLEEFKEKLENSKVCFILGGAKLKEPIKLMENCIEKNCIFLTTGILSLLFLIAKGYRLGYTKDYLEKEGYLEFIEKVRRLLNKFGNKIYLPDDLAIERNEKRVEIFLSELPVDEQILDIGETTINKYREIIKNFDVICVKGPAGIYEKQNFEIGTKKIFESLGKNTLVGGGNTIDALKKLGIDFNKFGYVSLSGGAFV